ncbi:unnamed protein product [Paramecium primaurelia]|uniref:Uncharacterized protein n=1 Tax=Paramecium primaurelia TaxID=5886 RepID=A0A8S1LTD8_PARPR|nr:unnamed protein product [Paramecium primaurelia]
MILLIILNLKKIQDKEIKFQINHQEIVILNIINQLKILINQLNYYQLKQLNQFYKDFQEHKVF